MAVSVFPLGPIQTNSYVINNGSEAVAVDVGGDPAPIAKYLRDNHFSLKAICITHMHFDHLYGVAALAKDTGAPVYTPEKDAPLLGTEMSQGGLWNLPLVPSFESHPIHASENAVFGGMSCRVMHVPGHTPGSLAYYFPHENCVFTGDTLFEAAVGRTDFPFGNHEQLVAAIRSELLSLPKDTIVYPGHGPSTTISRELRDNPYL